MRENTKSQIGRSWIKDLKKVIANKTRRFFLQYPPFGDLKVAKPDRILFKSRSGNKWDIMYECSKVSEPLFSVICILLVGGFPNILDGDDDDAAEEEW